MPFQIFLLPTPVSCPTPADNKVIKIVELVRTFSLISPLHVHLDIKTKPAIRISQIPVPPGLQFASPRLKFLQPPPRFMSPALGALCKDEVIKMAELVQIFSLIFPAHVHLDIKTKHAIRVNEISSSRSNSLTLCLLTSAPIPQANEVIEIAEMILLIFPCPFGYENKTCNQSNSNSPGSPSP